MENYIVINGKKTELTEEQLEKLGIKSEKYHKYFDRKVGYPYYYINRFNEIQADNDIGHSYTDIYDRDYEIGNYCRNKEIMEQRALHETLNRLLWRESVLARELDNKWNHDNSHYYIHYTAEPGRFDVDLSVARSIQGVCYFPTRKAAESAIETIIKPFLKEHPNFVW